MNRLARRIAPLFVLLLLFTACEEKEGHYIVWSSSGGDDSPDSAFLQDVESRIFSLAVSERLERGRDRYVRSSALSNAARLHCRDMVSRDFYSHVNPDGDTHTIRINTQTGVPVSVAGENINRVMYTSGESASSVAQRVINNWMGSPEHANNITSERFTHAGVGAVIHEGRVLVTMTFCAF